MYYASRAYAESIKSGGAYAQLKKVIGIHILCFNLFEDPRAYRKFDMRDREGDKEPCRSVMKVRERDLIIDYMELHFLELPKKVLHNMNHNFQLWFEFLKDPKETLMTHRFEIENHVALKKAFEALEKFSCDPKMRATYEAEIKEIRDKQAAIDTGWQDGRKEGHEEGREEGREEEQKNTVIKMLKKGFEPGEIANILDCDEQWIRSLQDTQS